MEGRFVIAVDPALIIYHKARRRDPQTIQKPQPQQVSLFLFKGSSVFQEITDSGIQNNALRQPAGIQVLTQRDLPPEDEIFHRGQQCGKEQRNTDPVIKIPGFQILHQRPQEGQADQIANVRIQIPQMPRQSIPT